MSNKDNIVTMTVEIPRGCSNKYEVNEVTHDIVLDRVLFGANFYPGEYGFVAKTLDWDGDPLDVLALGTYPTFPGCHVRVRILGTIKMIDDGEIDTKLFGVFADDPRWNCYEKLEDIPQAYRDECENFYMQYKQLQHKEVRINGWGDTAQAFKELQESFDRFDEYKDRLAKGEKDQIVEEWHKKGLGMA